MLICALVNSRTPQEAYFDLYLAKMLAKLGVILTLGASHVSVWLYILVHLLQDWLYPAVLTHITILEQVALESFVCGLPMKLYHWMAQAQIRRIQLCGGLFSNRKAVSETRRHTLMPRCQWMTAVNPPDCIILLLKALQHLELVSWQKSCYQLGYLAAQCPKQYKNVTWADDVSCMPMWHVPLKL